MKTKAQLDHEARVTQLIQAVLSNLDKDWTPADLAEHCGFSRFHFSRVFAGLTGETVGEALRRLRLERAAHELADTKRAIGAIALDAGYSPEAFSRAFRDAFQASPSEYRRSPTRRWLPSPNGVHYGECVVVLFQGCLPMKTEIRDMSPMKLLCRRHVGPYHEIGAAFDQLCARIGDATPVRTYVAIYYDDPGATEPRSDACAEVDAWPAETPEGLHRVEGPTGAYAVGLYQGPYQGLGEAWSRFMAQDLPATGRQPREGACFERYLNNPEDVPAEELLTEMWTPVA